MSALHPSDVWHRVPCYTRDAGIRNVITTNNGYTRYQVRMSPMQCAGENQSIHSVQGQCVCHFSFSFFVPFSQRICDNNFIVTAFVMQLSQLFFLLNFTIYFTYYLTFGLELREWLNQTNNKNFNKLIVYTKHMFDM